MPNKTEEVQAANPETYIHLERPVSYYVNLYRILGCSSANIRDALQDLGESSNRKDILYSQILQEERRVLAVYIKDLKEVIGINEAPKNEENQKTSCDQDQTPSIDTYA